ncbi:MAG: GNAT family N-acetyltransferase [Alphaproteobacteria bacterium]|nr:GNAT family N-acetyltransferase [Alphaproteobacteria bacterium]MBV9372781.1 GNAT family N-acetyltransferase [Alphaproteobacteria bacterium]MBV9900212.1 GNAT family N-acetyltransferase [Alphaproteobacteria bacterium]
MIETARLVVRAWRDSDSAPFFRINSDPEVMRHIRPSTTREESDSAIARQRAMQAELGHCFWALERREDGAFLGFCGLRAGVPGTPIADDIEIGWRLGREHWGRGYAREAAAACLAWGFDRLAAPRIVAITVAANIRSWSLMERLGMARRSDLDFLHPALPEGDPLRPHITYVMDRP